jgi:predicted GH43/DUF377 family glycosyl hydrolase
LSKKGSGLGFNRRQFFQGAAALSGAAIAGTVPGVANAATTVSGGNGSDSNSSEPALPEWAIGPFTRYANPRAVPYDGNPLIIPHGRWRGEKPEWESKSTFNPGVLYRDGKFQMLYRGESPNDHTHSGISGVGYAYSTDGHHFTEYSGNPVIVPSQNADPRLYWFQGMYYTFYTTHVGVNLARSHDMIHWEELGIALPRSKEAWDPALVADPEGNPVKIDGRYVMYYGADGAAFLVFSEDLIHWTDYTKIDLHFPASYRPWEICFAVTDYPTVEGSPKNTDILLFVAGTLMAQGRWFYAISQVLYSRDKLTQQLAQLTFPVLEPEMPYEVLGTAFRTVWMNSIFFHNSQWWMYYGAGDTVIALANAPLRSKDSVDLYNNFRGTGFETNQRMPDWVDAVDEDPGGGGIKNVSEFSNSGIGGPQAMVRYGYAPPLEYSKPQGIQSYAEPYIRIYDWKAHSGCASLLYSGSAQGKSENYAYLKLFDLSKNPIVVTRNTKLSYWIYPEDASSYEGANGLNSSHIALDLIFSDGTALRGLKAQDQHGNPLTPEGQGGHLNVNQWNQVESTIGSVAAGKQIVRISLGYSQPNLSGSYRGFIDDIALTV